MDNKTTCFLSYAREDFAHARKLYESLTEAGASVWFDAESLQPGEKWKPAILRGIRSSRYFIAILSTNSVSKVGFVQKELRDALDILSEYPDDEIYLIPARLDECQPTHDKLRELNWVNLFPEFEGGVSKLVHFFGLAPPESSETTKASLSDEDSLDTFSIIRFNGLYQSDKIDDYWMYHRFYDDGTVLSVSSTGEPKQVASWLVLKNAKNLHGCGTFYISGRQIHFSSESIDGTVDYTGSIEGNKIVLKFHSHINGNRGVREYVFKRL